MPGNMHYRFLLLLFLLTSQLANGQARYNFFTIGLEQGLSSLNVWSINQDKYGFIWIGTVNGLNRYDGHSIKQYYNRAKDSTSIAGNVTYWIHKDSDGDMWFACGSGGLSKYNYATDVFENLPAYDSARKHNKYNSPVWRVGEDAQKRLYLSCGAAMYRYTKKTNRFEDLTKLLGKNWDSGIGNFVMDGPNTMWMPTDEGFLKYDLAADTIRKIPFDVEKMGFGSSRLFDAELLNKEEILITIERGAYVIFNKKTEQFRPAADQLNPAKTGLYTEIGEVMKDTRGRYWMASSLLGLVQYFPTDGHLVSLKKELLYPYPYPEQEGSGKSIFEDKDGNIWYGTSKRGIVRFQPDFDFIQAYRRNYAKANTLADDNVVTFARSGRNAGMWMGTHKGICHFDPATNMYKNPIPASVLNGPNSPGMYVGALESFGDTVCMLTNKGLHFYNQQTNRYTAYTSTDTFFTEGIKAMLQVRPGELLVITKRFGSINLANGKFYDSAVSPHDPLYTITDINLVTVDKIRNVLWAQAGQNKLYEYDLNTKKLKSHYYNTSADTTKDVILHTMKADEDGHIWLGTSVGIIHYNPVQHTSHTFALLSGLEPVNNLEPYQGWIWFTTANSVGRLKRQTGQIETFDLHMLLPNAKIMARAMLRDSNGSIWIGTNQGFCLMNLAQFKNPKGNYYPALVSFKVFDQARYFDVPYNELKQVNLDYQENFFSIGFSSFNFQNTKGIKYAYKLEGFDKDWNYTTEYTASYTNVPPGDYTLLLRSSNSAYGWDDMKQPLFIHVGPPFWRSGLFITLCLVALAGIGFFMYKRNQKTGVKKSIDKSIDYFANSVYGNNSVTEICWDIARNCISQLHFEDCVVYLYDRDKNVLVQEAAYGPKNPKGHEIIHKIEIPAGQGIVGTVAQSGKPLLIPDTTKDSRYIVDDVQRCSELAVPILHEGKVMGVIDSEHPKKYFFNGQHLKALSTIASISANKIAEALAEAAAQDQAMQLLEIKKLFAESQLMALRAQMNPHFVFNCLNSIQECIVTQKYGEASNYLNKFSKLFRSVLNNSGKTLVSLQAEKEVLELYLQLEHMRFEGSFSFIIKADAELDMNDLLIPSMLLQPYVENALWHGLMHKEGERKLLIYFKYLNENIFQCIIDDNGIGRKKSAELKANFSKAKRHESKGMSISKDRIDLLQRQGQHATLKIIDNVDEEGNGIGTKVIVELSAELE
jgi:ligand-binding sensor domain-containing protein/putative methionine-R-sulfoxide reductase with GAF domain